MRAILRLFTSRRRRWRELFSLAIDERLSDAEAAELEGILDRWPAARRELEEMRAAVTALRAAPQVEPRRSFRLTPDMVEAPAPAPVRRIPAFVPAAAGAAALLVFAIIGGTLGLFGDGPPGEDTPPLAAAPPAATPAPEIRIATAMPAPTATGAPTPAAAFRVTAVPAATPTPEAMPPRATALSEPTATPEPMIMVVTATPAPAPAATSAPAATASPGPAESGASAAPAATASPTVDA